MTELEQIRARFDPIQTLAFQVLDIQLRVSLNDRRAADALAAYFADYAIPRAAGDALRVHLMHGEPVYDSRRLHDIPRSVPGKSIKEASYDAPDARIVVKRRTGTVLYLADPDWYVVGDLIANLGQAVNALLVAFARVMLHRGYMMLHASATLGTGGGIAFASESGAGKSTMALAMVERGHRFVTNDRLFLRALPGGVEMIGVPKLPRVNPGTLMRFPRLTRLMGREERERIAHLTREELWGLESKHDVDVDRFYGPGTFELRGWLRAIYTLGWTRGGPGWSIDPLDARRGAETLGRLAKTIGIYDRRPLPHDVQRAGITAITGHVPIYLVTGGTDIDRLVGEVLSASAAASS
jgi:HprK-related kinase B